VSQEQGDLTVSQPEGGFRDPLLMRSLTVDAQLPQPEIHSLRVPAVAVSADDQLVPVAPAGVPVHGASELGASGFGDQAAVVLRGRVVAQGLVNRIAAVADEVTEGSRLAKRWLQPGRSDPYFNPNLDLRSPDFGLALDEEAESCKPTT
jgi:hypothetical protein